MDFIGEIAPHAQQIANEFNILSSLIIAQAIHESNWGKSGLAVKGKNLFGVKGSYDGESITMPTWEVYNGKKVKVNVAFRKYPSWYESLYDLASLYKNGVSWDRNKYKAVIGETDYKKAAMAVQAAGYATDPNYATKLIKIIESNNLTKFDEKEIVKLYNPSIKTLIDVVENVLNSFSDEEKHGSKAIDKSWLSKLEKGELTDSDLIGLIFVAIDRGILKI